MIEDWELGIRLGKRNLGFDWVFGLGFAIRIRDWD